MGKGFGGFPGMPGNIQQMLKQAQKMKEQIEQATTEAESQKFDGSAGGGAVKAVANGKGILVSLVIQKDAVNPNEVELLQDLVLAAANDALAKAQVAIKGQMEKITGGMSLPGLF